MAEYHKSHPHQTNYKNFSSKDGRRLSPNRSLQYVLQNHLKIITRRLQPVLDALISENQSAFILGRAISDNVLIAHETLHFLKRSRAFKHCSMAVKTDMSKAYDMLEWSFVEAVLKKFGFHNSFIDRIFQCILSVSFSFLINGKYKGMIIPQREIRQSDPLSLYLFILCGEILSGFCRSAQRKGDFSRVRVARASPRINHILFPDETMFFGKTTPRSCEAVLIILQKYEPASGQVINPAKYLITFSNKTPEEVQNRVKAQLGIA